MLNPQFVYARISVRSFIAVGFYTTLCGSLSFRKQLSQLESEKRYLNKSNRHLENILEATHACKKQEVSELNRIHVETIKVQVETSLLDLT